jgi:hypothetical protein
MKKIITLFLGTGLIALSGCGLWQNRFDEQIDAQLEDQNTISETYTMDQENEETPSPDEAGKETGEEAESQDLEEGDLIAKSEAELRVDLTTRQEVEDLKEVLKKIQVENESLKAVIKSMESGTGSARDISTRAAETQITFKSCGQFANYQNFEWYNKLLTLLEKQKFPRQGEAEISFVNPDDISSSCFSENGALFIFLVSDPEAKSFTVIRYDTKMNSVQSAQVLAYDQLELSVPEVFGKRDGNTISLAGSTLFEDCLKKMDYSYDFVKNELTLIEGCEKCGGQEQLCQKYQ